MTNRLLAFFVIIICSSCTSLGYKSKISALLGINHVVHSRNVYNYDDVAGFGEGLTIETYEIDQTTIESFIAKKEKQLPGARNGWEKHDWSTNVLDTSFNSILEVAFNHGLEKSPLGKRLKTIKSLLYTNGCYYSFYYYPDKNRVYRVEFFIIDLSNGKFYAIESFI